MHAMLLGWSVPRQIRESRAARKRMTAQLEQQERDVNGAALITGHVAERVERAAVILMERHKQGMIDAAVELRRR